MSRSPVLSKKRHAQILAEVIPLVYYETPSSRVVSGDLTKNVGLRNKARATYISALAKQARGYKIHSVRYSGALGGFRVLWNGHDDQLLHIHETQFIFKDRVYKMAIVDKDYE
jgi:ribosomal protein L35AE/L33A